MKWNPAFICVTFLAVMTNRGAHCLSNTTTLVAATNQRVVFSPNWPMNYPSNINCSWHIRAPIGNSRIQLRVLDSRLACCCDQDAIIVTDGPNRTSRIITIWCSERNPFLITSSGNELFMEFHSNGDTEGMGFALEYNSFVINGSCPPGWVQRSEYCYRLYTDELSLWGEAASRCGYDAGNLVSILSREEHDFLVASYNNASVAWIGLDRNGVWLDGSIVSFLNFGQVVITGMCALIDLEHNNRLWTYADCDSFEANFICKKRADGTSERYWTVFEMNENEGGSSIPSYVTPIAIFFIFVLCTGCCNSEGGKNTLACICGIPGMIIECFAAILRRIRDFFRRLYRSCTSRLRRATPTNRNSNSIPARNTRANADANSHSSISLNDIPPSPTTTPPPSYLNDSHGLPPPSYTEALDPVYSISGTISDSQSSSSNVHLDVGGDTMVPAPSYESVVSQR